MKWYEPETIARELEQGKSFKANLSDLGMY